MKTLFSSILAVAVLFVTPNAYAATYIGDDMVFIENPIGGDAYVAGGKVMLEETVNGDLLVAGGDININGRISEDVLVAGGKIRIRGGVGDDVRVAGGEIEISGSVQGDVIVFGGRVEILSDITIAGDLIVNGGEVTMNGTVLGNTIINSGVLFLGGIASNDVMFKGGEIYLNGTIGGNLESVSEKIHVDADSRVRGDVRYWAKDGEAEFGNTVLGTVSYDTELKPYKDSHVEGAKAGLFAAMATLFAGAMVYKLLSALLVIALAVFGTRKYFVDGVKVLKKEPWMNALYGLLYFIATPILAVLFMVTLIGIPVGAAIMALYAITIAFAKPLTAVLLTKYWELTKRAKKAKALGNWQVVFISLGVYVVIKIACLVPIIGTLVVTFAVCAAYGALMRVEYAKYLKVR